jgi:hypothetical protein
VRFLWQGATWVAERGKSNPWASYGPRSVLRVKLCAIGALLAGKAPVRCRNGKAPYVCGMEQTSTRFEVRLPSARRQELEALARDTGLSAADLARLGIAWLLRHREVLTTGRDAARLPTGQSSQAAA